MQTQFNFPDKPSIILSNHPVPQNNAIVTVDNDKYVVCGIEWVLIENGAIAMVKLDHVLAIEEKPLNKYLDETPL